MTELAIHQLVYVCGNILNENGTHVFVQGWGKVCSPGNESVHVELATGLVGDEWADFDGERVFFDEQDHRVGMTIVIDREKVFTTEEVDPNSEPGVLLR